MAYRWTAGFALLLALAVVSLPEGAEASPPTVVAVSPANGATGVSRSTTISIAFDEEMHAQSVESSITVDPAFTWSAWWDQARTTVLLRPDARLPPAAYVEIRVRAGALAADGEALAADYSFFFSTEPLVGPTVLATSPESKAQGVALDTVVRIVFSMPMNRTATEFAILVSPNTPHTHRWNEASTALEIGFAAGLDPGTFYAVTIRDSARSAEGVPISIGYGFGFTTEVAPSPIAPAVPFLAGLLVGVAGTTFALVLTRRRKRYLGPPKNLQP